MPKKPAKGQDQTAAEQQARDAKAHVDRLLDQALSETFPASDPVSTLVSAEPRQPRPKKS